MYVESFLTINNEEKNGSRNYKSCGWRFLERIHYKNDVSDMAHNQRGGASQGHRRSG